MRAVGFSTTKSSSLIGLKDNFSSRTDPSIFTVIRPVKRNRLSLSSMAINKPLPANICSLMINRNIDQYCSEMFSLIAHTKLYKYTKSKSSPGINKFKVKSKFSLRYSKI